MRKIINYKKVKQLAKDCLNEMYIASTPSISWEDYCTKYGNTKIEGFKNHYLSQDKYEEILNKYSKRIATVWQASFYMQILNYSPTSQKNEEHT